jgi:hypothetical protein
VARARIKLTRYQLLNMHTDDESVYLAHVYGPRGKQPILRDPFILTHSQARSLARWILKHTDAAGDAD